MVVNWTGKGPDRPGYWLMAYKITHEDWQGREWNVSLVYVNSEMNYFCHDVSDMYGPIDELINKKVLINHNEPDNYILKFSTTPVQIDNVNFEYKYDNRT
jgi:hypothetical protein